MRVADLQRLFDYNYWANAHVFAALGQVPAAEFTRPVAGSYGSVRNTMVHILSAEWGWLERCGGPARGPRLDPADFPTLESVQKAWAHVEASLRGFLATQRDEDLGRRVTFAFGGGLAGTATVGDLLQHAAVHAAHHRGQVALLLRELGYPPGNFDFLLYAKDEDPGAS